MLLNIYVSSIQAGSLGHSVKFPERLHQSLRSGELLSEPDATKI